MNQPILILADPKGNAWEFANKVHEILNSRDPEMKYQLERVEITKFADGEMYVKILGNVRKKTCFYIHDSSMNPQDWIVSLALVNDALMRASAGEINNILPYMKYGRQDRIAEPRTPISSSFVAKIVNYSAQRAITTDLHNPATTGSFIIPCDNLRAYPVIIDYIKKNYSEFLENAVIVAPDSGSAKRAESYAKRLNLSYAITEKKREKAGVVGSMTLIGDVEGKNVLIVDDMIDTAGTLCKSAEILHEKGAKDIYACATHGLFSKDALERIENSKIKKLIITDSIPQKTKGKTEIVSLANLFAETIYRIDHGDSISELFG
jgi:ribose-phosphate pyrophosphokinase